MMGFDMLRMRNASAGGGVPANAHTYWRMYISAVSSNYAVLTDLQFRATAGGADQVPVCTQDDMSPNGIAICSGFDANSQAYRAFDSFINGPSLWAQTPTAPPAWIGFHFPSAVAVEEFSFTTFDDTRFLPTDFKIQYSDDGITWNDRAAFAAQTIVRNSTYVYACSSASPVFSVAPTVSTDTGFFGTGDVATVTYANNGSSSAIAWLRDGVPISGATSASYTYVSGDVGHTVAARVTASPVASDASPTVATSAGNSIVTPTFATDTRVPAGDMQSGSDSRLTAGDMQSGTDLRIITTRTA